MGEWAAGAWGFLVALASVAFLALLLLDRFRRRHARDRIVGSVSPFASRLIEVMCHVAKADGHIDNREVALIASIATSLSDEPVTDDDIRRCIDLSVSALVNYDYVAFGRGMNGEQKGRLLKGAVMVAAADGAIADQEGQFLSKLAGAFKIDQRTFDTIVAQVLAAPRRADRGT